MLYYLQQVMMIAPIDADEDEAKCVAEKYWGQRDQRSPSGVMRDFELQHHNRDDDGDHSIAESFQTVLSHLFKSSASQLKWSADILSASVQSTLSAPGEFIWSIVRAARSGGQDVRDPLKSIIRKDDSQAELQIHPKV
jgi:hypothetical protein